MRVKNTKKPFFSLESVAMTDIVLNLFIFFFVSFSLLYTFNPHKESKIEVQLPQGAVHKEAKGQIPLVVSVTQGNEIFIGKNLIRPEELKEEFVQRYSLAKDFGVLVRADKLASVDFLVKVLDAAKQSGIERLGVAIEKGR